MPDYFTFECYVYIFLTRPRQLNPFWINDFELHLIQLNDKECIVNSDIVNSDMSSFFIITTNDRVDLIRDGYLAIDLK